MRLILVYIACVGSLASAETSPEVTALMRRGFPVDKFIASLRPLAAPGWPKRDRSQRTSDVQVFTSEFVDTLWYSSDWTDERFEFPEREAGAQIARYLNAEYVDGLTQIERKSLHCHYNAILVAVAVAYPGVKEPLTYMRVEADPGDAWDRARRTITWHARALVLGLASIGEGMASIVSFGMTPTTVLPPIHPVDADARMLARSLLLFGKYVAAQATACETQLTESTRDVAGGPGTPR